MTFSTERDLVFLFVFACGFVSGIVYMVVR